MTEEKHIVIKDLQYCDFVCPDCDSAFMSAQMLAVHRYRQHGTLRQIRAYAEGAVCYLCLQVFDNRRQLIGHLAEKSPRCAFNLMLRCPPLDRETQRLLDLQYKVDGRNAVASGHHRSWGPKDVEQSMGPSLPPILNANFKINGINSQYFRQVMDYGLRMEFDDFPSATVLWRVAESPNDDVVLRLTSADELMYGAGDKGDDDEIEADLGDDLE